MTSEQNTFTPQEASEDASDPSPMEQVKEQQAMARENLEVAQQRDEPSPEVPGASNPSNRRHFPQRQMYDGKKQDEK